MGQARDVVEQWWRAFEAKDVDRSLNLIADEFEFRFGGETMTTKAQLRGFLEMWLRGFPDLHHEVVHAIEAGDSVALELRVHATHSGPFATPSGDVPATGRKLLIESADIVTVKDGRIKSWHVYNDRMAMMGQLGLLPEPAQPTAV